MDYEYYLNTYNGKATKAAFDSYITQAADLLLIYVHRFASVAYADQDLDFFGDFSKALCYEVDCLIAYGSDAMNGMPSDANVESVTTSGFSIKYASRDAYFTFEGMPMASMARNLADMELTKNGFSNRCIGL